MKFKSNIELQSGLEDNNATSGTSGQVLSSTGTGVEWIDQSAITEAKSNFVYFEVKNETGSTINKGKGVMAVGTDGNSGHILIDEMVADGSVEPKYFLGVLETTVANGGFARVISFGQLDQFDTRGQNGETWNDGNILWCDPDSAGDFTITEPLGPNVKIAAAIVLNASTNGKIQVRVQANEGVHDLHDTKITSQTDGDVLVWNNTEKVWFNDSTLNVDYTNGRVGIGTTSPSEKLDVDGDVLFGTVNKFTTDVNVFKSNSTGQNGILLRSSISTAANPSFSNVDDPNTGMFLPGSDVLGLSTAGTERMRIISNGNVGIGTTSPSAKLDLGTSGALKVTQSGVTEVYVEGTGVRLKNIYTGGGWARGILTYENSTGTDYFQLGGYGNGQTFTYGYIGAAYNNNALRWYPNNNVFVGNDLNVSNNLVVGSTSTTSYVAETAGGSLAVSESIGVSNLGIELKGSRLTSIPSAQVKGYIGIGDSAIGTTGDMLIAPRTNVNASIRFITGTTPSEKVRIDGASGNVGIGTTSPNAKLDIRDGELHFTSSSINSNPSGIIRFNEYGSGSSVSGAYIQYNGASNYFSMFTNTETVDYEFIRAVRGSHLLLQPSSGNVGIGTTSPGSKLEVNGTFNVNSIGDRVIIADPSNGSFSLGDLDGLGDEAQIVGDGSTIKINNAGNNTLTSTFNNRIGIGTTSPSAKLDVVGKISLNDGGQNVYIGYNAGLSDDATDNRNVGVGHLAMYSNTSGYFNTATGYNALRLNTTGYYNSAFGYASLYRNTTGAGNVANGPLALYNNTTASNNTATGYQSLYFNQTGTANTAHGYQSLYLNTASYNTAFGYRASFLNTTGNNNSSFGVQALNSMETGSYNTSVGSTAMYLTTSGNANTALGARALYFMATGSNNVAIGYDAGFRIANGANNTSSDTSIFIGRDTRPNAVGESNQIVIGWRATGLGSNTAVLGDDSITTTALKGAVGIATTTPAYKLDVSGDGRFTGDVRANSFITTSDSNLKTNIKDIPDTKISLKYKEYALKDDTSGRKRYGILADDIKTSYPELVHYNEKGQAGVDYISLLVKKVAELESEISLLNKRLDGAGIK